MFLRPNFQSVEKWEKWRAVLNKNKIAFAGCCECE